MYSTLKHRFRVLNIRYCRNFRKKVCSLCHSNYTMCKYTMRLKYCNFERKFGGFHQEYKRFSIALFDLNC